MPVNRIILYNTEKKYFTPFEQTYHISQQFKNVSVFHHSKEEFDHGKTRNRGVQESDAEIFVCMTDDAIPKDEYLIEKLYEGLMRAQEVAVCYARQLANDDCKALESYTRTFNYPDQSRLKSKADMAELGIKTFFCSNVCAAYKREIFDSLGGFIDETIFNEDMIFAGNAIKAGYSIYYSAQAMVIHSHNYSSVQQFHRNFDLGVSQAQHPEIFAGIKSESEGIKLVLDTSRYLIKHHKYGEIFRLYTSSAAKLLGYRLGKGYKKLPRRIVLMCAMNKEYFKKRG